MTTPKPFCLTVSLLLRQGTEAEAAAHLRVLAEQSRLEPGCLVYNVHQPAGEPRRVFIYELYIDAAALEAHHNTLHFAQHAVAGLYHLVESREANIYDSLDARA